MPIELQIALLVSSEVFFEKRTLDFSLLIFYPES